MTKSSVKPILGQSKAVHELLKWIAKVAAAKTNVLVIGESGTGKELVARMIHDTGPLKDKAFVPVNCGAIPANLIESELFGHKRGSFTGAVSDKDGLFQVAHGGTLFLDEVGELPLALQVKLLRAIQERTIRKVGGTDDVKVDVRIIAATNRDLEAAVRQGTFREDLYYRLNVIQLKTPPLREREGDVKLLAEHFLKRFSERSGRKVEGFTDEAWAALDAHPWPGNVRELENVIERAVTLAAALGKIGPEQLPFVRAKGPQAAAPATAAGGGGPESVTTASTPDSSGFRLPSPDFTQGSVPLQKILEQVERTYFEAALKAVGGVRPRAADLLQLPVKTFQTRAKKLGI